MTTFDTGTANPLHRDTPGNATREAAPEWPSWQRVLFRIAFVFFTLLIVPLNPDYYKNLFSVSTVFDFFFALMGYRPNFVSIASDSGRWGLASYATLGVAALAAVAAGLLWTFLARNSRRKEYNELNYWLSLVVRYRIAVGIIAFGYIKLYPVQMPYPGLGTLHTNFGDFAAFKLYWHSVGVVLWYEVFLGFVEVLAGTLMLFRSTFIWGAVINAGVLYNIAHANHAYDGGVHVYSALFVVFSAYLLAQYIPSVWKLIVKEQDVQPPRYFPVYHARWKRNLATGVKYSLIFIFVVYYGYLRYDLHYVQKETKEPKTPGLANTAGYYHVSEFRLNDEVLPYSPLDSVRWHDVIFEKHSTLIYRVNRKNLLSLSNGSRQERDIDRNYELSGTAGGKRYFYYEADTTKQLLHLFDKGEEAKRAGGRRRKRGLGKISQPPDLTLHYQQIGDSKIILSGINQDKDSIRVVLDKSDKQYPIQMGAARR